MPCEKFRRKTSTPRRDQRVERRRRAAGGTERRDDLGVPRHDHGSTSAFGMRMRLGVRERLVQLAAGRSVCAPISRNGIDGCASRIDSARRKCRASLPQQPRISRCLRLICWCALIVTVADVGVVAGDDVASADARQIESFRNRPRRRPPPRSRRRRLHRGSRRAQPAAARRAVVVVEVERHVRRPSRAPARAGSSGAPMRDDRATRRRCCASAMALSPTAPVPCTTTESPRRISARSAMCTAVSRPQPPPM